MDSKEADKLTERVANRKITLREFIYRLFFKRTDDLDTLQLLFNAIVIVSLLVVWNVFKQPVLPPEVMIEAMVTLRWMMGLLVVTAVPVWLVPFVKNPFNNKSESTDVHSMDMNNEQH